MPYRSMHYFARQAVAAEPGEARGPKETSLLNLLDIKQQSRQASQKRVGRQRVTAHRHVRSSLNPYLPPRTVAAWWVYTCTKLYTLVIRACTPFKCRHACQAGRHQNAGRRAWLLAPIAQACQNAHSFDRHWSQAMRALWHCRTSATPVWHGLHARPDVHQ